MNTHTEAERNAARVIATSVNNMALRMSDYATPGDREAASYALRAQVAETLLGEEYVIVPRYVLAELRKQMEELPA